MQLLVEAIGFGIASGAVIALGAVGFSVQFGMSNILNITYGSLMTLGAYAGLFFVDRSVNVWVALAIAGVVVGIVSVLFHRLLLAPLVRRGTRAFALVIVTVSAGVVLQYLIVAFAGTDAKTYGEQSGQTFHLGWIVLTASQVAIILLTTALMIGLHLLLTRTTLGRAMRATASNRILAQSCGIDTGRVSDLAWLLSGALCGAAGVALAITTVSFDFTLGPVFLIPMIAAAVLGGIGQPYGAMLGGLVVGIAGQVAAAFANPQYSEVAAFAILIVMLLVRPRGLFGAAWATRRLMA
ncbi:MAG TPA: branched-chain amino acid ABC transporter permease [Candidatus Dormibacteraeota bacterium]|jgi:branched-chain amino acid transport system permease protein/neutral amino acid transport system permease protein